MTYATKLSLQRQTTDSFISCSVVHRTVWRPAVNWTRWTNWTRDGKRRTVPSLSVLIDWARDVVLVVVVVQLPQLRSSLGAVAAASAFIISSFRLFRWPSTPVHSAAQARCDGLERLKRRRSAVAAAPATTPSAAALPKNAGPESVTVKIKHLYRARMECGVALYGSETWTLNKRGVTMLEASKMWTWSPMVYILWKD